MIRPLATEVALFLAPFAAYAVFLWATRAGVLDPDSWPASRVAWLTISALVLLLGSFLVIAQFSHSRPGSAYVPAHVENGKLVPGAAK
jgi:heme/copper-type cytochrome/quinol oxidase subunit 3